MSREVLGIVSLRWAILGIIYLVLQLAAVAHAHLGNSRWLAAWAPNDYALWYRLEVHASGKLLSPDETSHRYHVPCSNEGELYQNPAQNLIDIIRQYEQTYGRNDPAQVTLFYQPNGVQPPLIWRWPEK